LGGEKKKRRNTFRRKRGGDVTRCWGTKGEEKNYRNKRWPKPRGGTGDTREGLRPNGIHLNPLTWGSIGPGLLGETEKKIDSGGGKRT